MGMPGPFEIIILAAFALVPLLLLVGIIVLLVNEKTRIAGIVLLCLVMLGGVGVVGLAAVMWYAVRLDESAPFPDPIEIERVPASRFPEEVAPSAEGETALQPPDGEEPPEQEEPLAEEEPPAGDTKEQAVPEDAGSD
jgi:hypothetical protein